MLNFFAQKRRLFTFLAIALVITTIAFTVVVSQEQQTIKQRAAFNAIPSGKEIDLYFTASKDCNDTSLKNAPTIKFKTSESPVISLCIGGTSIGPSGISGFNILISADNHLTFNQVASATNDFGSNPPVPIDGNTSIRFKRVATDKDIPFSNNPLRILEFALTNPVAETGTIKFEIAEIVSLTREKALEVGSPSLTYDSGVVPSPTPNTTCSNLPSCGAAVVCATLSTCGSKCASDQFQCLSASDVFCCKALPTPTPTPGPNRFTCEGTETAKGLEGTYQCGEIKNPDLVGDLSNIRCPLGYGSYKPPSPFTGTSCETNVPKQGCCVKAAPTPTTNPNAITINLVTGTNFISLPVISADNRISTLIPAFLESKIESIYYIDPDGIQTGYIPGPAADDLLTLGPGKGYLIKVKNTATLPATLILTGTPYEFQPINLTANKWYAIGAPAIAVKISDVIGTCNLLTLQLRTVSINGSQSAITLTDNTLFEPKKGYWINSPTTCILSKTVAPTGTNLILNLNVQDVTIPGILAPEISVYNFTDKSLVTHAPALQFTKSSFTGIQYKSGMFLPNLPQGKYLIVTRQQINNSTTIAKSSFTVSGANQTINVPAETKAMTLVFGDLSNDDNINVSDHYNVFRYCLGQLASANINSISCTLADFDNNDLVNQIDFNTFLRGWATWNKESKDLQ